MNHETEETHERMLYKKERIFDYLKETGLNRGPIVNFGRYPKAQVRRIIPWNPFAYFVVRGTA